MTTVLAIDQGTSGTKAVVVGEAGDVLALSEVSIRPTYLPGGGVEHDPQALLDSVLRAGRVAVNQARVDIDIVTIANQGETVLAWDPDTGTPLSNMIVWQDRRSESICAGLKDHAGDIAARTGLVLDPYFSAPKQAWIRQNVTDEGVVTTSDSWLLHQLTGEFVTDASTASRSLVMDLDTVAWDRELLDIFALGEERLPTILACDDLAGTTTAFGSTAVVGGLIVDQQAALVAQACLQPGEAKCTFGTGAFLLANTGRNAVRSSASLSSSVAWQQGGRSTYCLDGQVYTAASAVQWLEKLTFIDTAADMDHVAADDSHGVLCVPALAGLAAPWWRPDATATFTGMTLSTGSEHLVRAVLEGIAAQVAELARAMTTDLGQPLQRLRVDGGLTQSRVLMQAVADLMRIPVDVYPSQHATPLGAAALARCAMKKDLALEDAIISWAPSHTYEPRWSDSRAEEFSARWRAAADALT
ncbi:carbohydrate kinase [Microbacterium esteraromaticum]|uniref:ATP:glycerol 3-phosphotransferase n=1 Tax=Microbacterium esteraromaticum TaxID=57043 RepID=A0A7D7WEA9_9MICO|nr:FGGY family carbohydrate kinase [Microbacterium esteraromaticum]QMU97239.1 carbohydrate kinase [Microbacterium esteraromaticum]